MDLVRKKTYGDAQSRKRKSDVRDAEFRIQANARERERTDRLKTDMPISSSSRVNVAFAMVRQLIPTEPPDRKMSKIEILKLATSYIQHLKCHCIAGTGAEENQACEDIARGSWMGVTRPSCSFCSSALKKVLHETAEQSSQGSRSASKKRPSNKHIQPEPSFTTTAGFNYSPWVPAYSTSAYQMSSPAAQDYCRCPHTSVHPHFIQPQDLCRFSEPHQNPHKSSFAEAKPSLNGPFYPRNDGFRTDYPVTKDELPSVGPRTGLGGISEDPVNLSYSENCPKQLTSSAEDKPNSSLDSLLGLYSRMHNAPQIPVTKAKNVVANFSSVSTRTTPKLEPATSTPNSLMKQSTYGLDSQHSAVRIPTSQDDVKTYFTTARDDFNFSTTWDYSRQSVPTSYSQNGVSMSTNMSHNDSQEEFNYTSTQETIPTTGSHGLDYPPVWGESSTARLFLNL